MLGYNLIHIELQILFEVMVFVTVYWNALDRPRERHTDVSRILYRDGFIYFIVSPSLIHVKVLPPHRFSPDPNL